LLGLVVIAVDVQSITTYDELVLVPLDGVGPTVGIVIRVAPALLSVEAVDVPALLVAYTVAIMRSPIASEYVEEKTLIGTVHYVAANIVASDPSHEVKYVLYAPPLDLNLIV
jgi:hypothetical protein